MASQNKYLHIQNAIAKHTERKDLQHQQKLLHRISKFVEVPVGAEDNKILAMLRTKYKFTNDCITVTKHCIEIEAGRPCCRQDHYMCGNEHCECIDQEGWCETWYEDDAKPVIDEFVHWVSDAFDPQVVIAKRLRAHIGEKGHMYISFSCR